MRDSGFITATMTGERYADMLQNCIIPSLANKHQLECTIVMQDGPLPHIARCMKDLLHMSFGDDRGSVATFVMLGLPGPKISICAIIGFGVT